MNFEELQVIWNNQNNETMYAINEGALHDYIKNKGQSVNFKLNFQEFILIGINLLVGIQLTIAAFHVGNPALKLFLSVFYLGFAIYGAVRRSIRRNEEKPFDRTLVGELDKAIWRIDYLMQQNRNLIRWYILPLTLLFGVLSFFNTKMLLAFGVCLVSIVFAHFTSRWENDKFHIPNKRNLEALRIKLIKQENQ